MIIRATTDYALRIMTALVTAKGALSSAVLAEYTHIPQKYLVKVAATLKSSGLLTSVQGFRGGYMLAKPAENITLWDIFCSVDAACRVVDVPDGPDPDPLVAGLFAEMNALTRRYLAAATLAAFAAQNGKGEPKGAGKP